MKCEKKAIDDEKWNCAKDRHEIRTRRWKFGCAALSKGEDCPPKPHCRCKADVTEGMLSSFELSEGMSEWMDMELATNGSSSEGS